MSDFPRMIYRVGRQEEMHGGRFDYEIVHDQDALDAMLTDGWHLTTCNAKAAAEKPTSPVQPVEMQPKREDIEADARALGIAFDGRTTDAKLLAKIDVAKSKEAP